MDQINSQPSVAVKDLHLAYGSVNVLNHLNLDIAEGEFIVLLGPSGCGKSTLLNCIAGLLDITDGQIWIKGKNVTWEEPKDRGIGMVFQSYALYPQMSVRGNLSFGLKNAGLPKAEIDKRIKRASEILQIEPLLDRKPAALSGGQRQRVAIGRALVRDVDVFLFDEPLVEPRRQAPLRAPRRDQAPAPAAREHDDLRHPRPDRGADPRRPDRGDARRLHPAARRPQDHLQQAGQPLRRRLHRLAGDDHAQGQDRRHARRAAASRPTASPCRSPATTAASRPPAPR